MTESSTTKAEQFDTPEQQKEAATLGMWTFLATEVLFFGALFVVYTILRHFYPEGFAAASKRTNVVFGTINSVILLTSSLSVALAVRAANMNNLKTALRGLTCTILLAISFLVVKAFEYKKDIADHLVPGPHFTPDLPPGAQAFFWLYWVMTGLHALHVTVGIFVLTEIRAISGQKHNIPSHRTTLELAALYWHFVDIVWIFLYPLLYLVNRLS